MNKTKAILISLIAIPLFQLIIFGILTSLFTSCFDQGKCGGREIIIQLESILPKERFLYTVWLSIIPTAITIFIINKSNRIQYKKLAYVSVLLIFSWLLFRMYLHMPMGVNGESMLPTFEDEEYIGASYRLLPSDKLNYGDVITFSNKETNNKDWIKRVIGLPGDNVSIKNGYVYVNDLQIEELYVLKSGETWNTSGFMRNGVLMIVPENHFFVLGDNRENSTDSRVIGFVDRKDIEAILPFGESRNEKFKCRWKTYKSEFCDTYYR